MHETVKQQISLLNSLERLHHLEWLKAHREEFVGYYVALDWNRLVGQGRMLHEAHAQARQNGVENPFLVRVKSENEVLFHQLYSFSSGQTSLGLWGE